jgi:peptidoglycan hydrolase CwlO-like protein
MDRDKILSASLVPGEVVVQIQNECERASRDIESRDSNIARLSCRIRELEQDVRDREATISILERNAQVSAGSDAG